MSTSAIDNPLPVPSDSKSSRKKKTKSSSPTAPSPAVPSTPPKENSSQEDSTTNGSAYEHPHLKDLQKQIRNITKRLTALSKIDAICAENPGVSLNDLVAQRKINNDQKAAAEKKPGLLEQVKQLEEQIVTFRKVNEEYAAQMLKQREEIMAANKKEMEKVKEELRVEGVRSGASELRKKLLVFSQFLRAAAAKRNVEEEAGTDESQAFEGALLLVYGGDQKAVEAAVNIVEGNEVEVVSIEGTPLPVKYSQIRQASIDHAPFQAEEAWVNDVAEANADPTPIPAEPAVAETSVPTASDPTLANATLIEREAESNANGTATADTADIITSPAQTSAGDEAGNSAGDRWDTGAGAEKTENGTMEDSYEMIASDVPSYAQAQPEEKAGGMSWADETTLASSQTEMGGAAEGNAAGEGWDTKPAGQTEEVQTNGWAQEAATAAGEVPVDDGFQQIPNRHRGRGGRGGPRGGDGEGRGRGGRGGRGGYRGEGGEFKGGRGRGEFRGGRGRGEGGEHRGRGGRGRGGPRGDGAPRAG